MISITQTKSIIRILKEASTSVLKIYKDENKWNLSNKGDDSPLTEADRISNEIICENLRLLTPTYLIISEENKQIPFDERKNAEFLWCIDPLDGTKEFLKKNDEFAINIALIYKNEVVAGFVSVPVQNTIYWAIKGKGAYKIDFSGEEKRIFAKKFKITDNELNVIASRSHMDISTQAFINTLTNPTVKSAGSALKFLLIAEGLVHIYPRLAPTMEWDTAAPQIILEEAGGYIGIYGENSRLSYNKEILKNPYFIAYGGIENPN